MLLTVQLLATAIGLVAALLAAKWLHRTGRIVQPPQTGRLGTIDGLRGYLALAVAVHHFFVWTLTFDNGLWNNPDVRFFDRLGTLGVAVFFLITGALFYERVARQSPVNWAQLYISRIFRLLPLAWSVMVLVITVALIRQWPDVNLSMRGFAFPVLGWFSFAEMIDVAGFPNTRRIIAGVMWSLRVEWIFYLALPVLAFAVAIAEGRVTRLSCVVILFLLSLPIYFFSATLRDAGLPKALEYATRWAPLFFVGMISLELSRIERFRSAFNSGTASWIGTAAALSILILPGAGTGLIFFVLLAVFFTPVLSGNTYFGILTLPESTVLSEISYSIYLMHGLVLFFFMTSHLGASLAAEGKEVLWLTAPLAIAAIVLVSALTYRLIERPGINIGKKISRHYKQMKKQVEGPA